MSSTQDVAYFLHQTPFRDNSAIVHCLTQKNGKVSFLISGLKAKKNPRRPFLQPCQRLTLDYQLKTGLSKLEHIDFDQHALKKPDIAQFMFYQYANELLLTVLPDHLPTPTLFDDYSQFLSLLTDNRTHTALRHIECSLIILFSGLPNLSQTEDTHEVISQEKSYYFYPEQGIFTHKQFSEKNAPIDGAQILAFHHVSECYINHNIDSISETIAHGAKPLSTQLVNQLLNGKVLKTRSVFQALQSYI